LIAKIRHEFLDVTTEGSIRGCLVGKVNIIELLKHIACYYIVMGYDSMYKYMNIVSRMNMTNKNKDNKK